MDGRRSDPHGRSYVIHMAFFLNAKHRVEFNGTRSQMHSHSWRLEVDFGARFCGADEAPAVEFADLDRAVRSILRPYEAGYLNDLPPFDRVVPVTENIARFLFGAIAEAVAIHEVQVLRVTLWEAPTKGVTINTGLPAAALALDEVAAAGEAARGPAPDPPSGRGSPPVRGPDLDRSGRPGERGALRVGILAPIAAVASIIGLVIAFYHPYLTAQPGQAYPWGLDTWAHLFKAEYLLEQLVRDNPYPVLLPWWYNGLELFRYWSPLPIYVLAGLGRLAGDIFVGGAWLVPLASAFGGLSWLLYSSRIGWLPATMAGLAWTIWPDHLFLAVYEGNLPRVVATALFPLLFLCFLSSIEGRRWPWSGCGVVALVHVVILCHAMTGAMVSVAFTIFALAYWLVAGIRGRDALRGVALLALGVLSTAWWLVPSLSGGLVSMSAEVLRDLVPTIPGRFTPSDPRGFLMGLLATVVLAMVALTWRARPRLARAAFLCALGGLVITIPQVIPFYVSLPLGHLMWPTRFTGLNAVPLILAFVAWGAKPDRTAAAPARPAAGGRLTTARHLVAALAIPVLALVSGNATTPWLHSFAPVNTHAEELARSLAARPGWRVALLMPHLTSELVYQLSALGQREQVYGFAWQGAKTAPQLVLINEALERGDFAYAIDRAWQFGATDLAVDTRQVTGDRFTQQAEALGFQAAGRFGTLALYSREGGAQAYVSPYRALAVGRLAGVASSLFPGVETGRATLESYPLEELGRYDTLFLTGLEWSSKTQSEAMVRAYLRDGGKVVVDLTRFPADVLSGRPSFLGVTGESVALQTMPTITLGQDQLALEPFAGEFDPWVTHFLVGLDEVTASFDHYGQQAAVLGSKTLAEGNVHFVGLNLPFHAQLTRDPVALAVLSQRLGVDPGAAPLRPVLPLDAYQAGASGYSFELTVPEAYAGQLLILPFAAPDSVRVRVDGAVHPHLVVENLVAVTLASGPHSVEVAVGLSPLAPVGALISMASVFLLTTYVAVEWQRSRARTREVIHHATPV